MEYKQECRSNDGMLGLRWFPSIKLQLIWFNMNLLMSMFGYVLLLKWMLKGSAVCEQLLIEPPPHLHPIILPEQVLSDSQMSLTLNSPCVRFQIDIIVAEIHAPIHALPNPCEVQCMCWYFYHECSWSIPSVLLRSNWMNSQTEITVNMLNITLPLYSAFSFWTLNSPPDSPWKCWLQLKQM